MRVIPDARGKLVLELSKCEATNIVQEIMRQAQEGALSYLIYINMEIKQVDCTGNDM